MRLVSPDNRWEVVIDENGNVRWVDLTKVQGRYTIEEIVEATKKILTEVWQ